MGVAGAHGVGTIVPVLPAARTPAQEDHRLGPADGHVRLRRTPPAPLSTQCAGKRNGYAVLDLLHCSQSLREPVTLIARLRLDAALYAPAPPRQPGQNGRPPLKGERRPSLKAILEQDQAAWTVAAVAWYDGTTRIVELVSQTAVWYRSGQTAGAPSLGADPSPPGCLRSPSLARHRPGSSPDPDTPVVCPALVRLWRRNHLPGSPNLSGFGDPAPLVRPGHRPHYAHPAGSLLLHHSGRPHPATRASHHPAHRGLVRQTVADAIALVRRHLWLASDGFSLSAASTDMPEFPATLYHRLDESLVYAA